MAGKLSAQENVLVRATKKLINEQVMFDEIGPVRLNKDIEKHIWGDKPHLSLWDLWEYHNRYVYLPRLRDKDVLANSVFNAISQTIPGPFAYAERFDDLIGQYEGLIIEMGINAPVVIDRDSVIVRLEIAEKNRPASDQPDGNENMEDDGIKDDTGKYEPEEPNDVLPKRFRGTVLLSSERSVRDMQQVVEAIIEQITTIPGSSVELKLEIDAEVPSGLDKAKVQILTENANTLGFIDKELN